MKQFLCECKKTKAKLLSILLPVLALILVWSLYLLYDPDEQMKTDGFTYMTISLMMLNSILLPATMAVLASRLMDMENKGNTYKLLCTLQSKSSIFSCKLLLALLHILAFFVLETLGVLVIGKMVGITETIPLSGYLRVQGFGILACLATFIWQMFFSLRLENQLYPLFIGLIGSFVGLFSLFFPSTWILPWCWFQLGAYVAMDYSETTKITTFTPVRFDPVTLVIVLLMLLVSFIIVRRYFLRKDV